MEQIIDIGCGPRKNPHAFGMDIHPYEGVDLVHNLNQAPWPIEDNRFDRVVCSHVVEHIDNPTAFFKEIHRISKPGAVIEIATPHFSSLTSYSDPTHKWHYAATWYEPLTGEGYLAAQTGHFELIDSQVSFGKSLRNFIPKLMIKLKSLVWWEKNYSFLFPARDISTKLAVVK